MYDSRKSYGYKLSKDNEKDCLKDRKDYKDCSKDHKDHKDYKVECYKCCEESRIDGRRVWFFDQPYITRWSMTNSEAVLFERNVDVECGQNILIDFAISAETALNLFNEDETFILWFEIPEDFLPEEDPLPVAPSRDLGRIGIFFDAEAATVFDPFNCEEGHPARRINRAVHIESLLPRVYNRYRLYVDGCIVAQGGYEPGSDTTAPNLSSVSLTWGKYICKKKCLVIRVVVDILNITGLCIDSAFVETNISNDCPTIYNDRCKDALDFVRVENCRRTQFFGAKGAALRIVLL